MRIAPRARCVSGADVALHPRSFTFASVLPGEVAPAVLLPCFATLHTLVAGFLITHNTIPSASRGLGDMRCAALTPPPYAPPTLAVIWRWLYTISYQQWLWSALMINQFRGQSYSAYCRGAGSTLEAFAQLLPGPAVAPPQQLAALAGACRMQHAASRCAHAALTAHRSSAPAALGSTGCEPLHGDDMLGAFDLRSRSKWVSLGYAALTFPVLCLLFYLGVRHVRHEKR